MAQRPLVLITLCYIASLVSGNLFQTPPYVVFPALAGIALVCAVAYNRRYGVEPIEQSSTGPRSTPPSYYLFLAPVATVVFLTLWSSRPTEPPVEDVSRHIPRDKQGEAQRCAVIGFVCSDVREVEMGRIQFDLRAERIFHRRRGIPVTGKVRITMPGDPDTTVHYGDRIRMVAILKKPSEATNPGQFSSQKHLTRERIYCRAEVEERKDLAVVGGEGRLDPEGVSIAMRHWTLDLFKTTMPRPYSELAAKLMCSIVYGISASPLPGIIEEPFRDAGVFHILVASGTQVALIVGVLLLLSGRAGLAPFFQAVLVVPLIALYTMVAGGQPAIVRAAVTGTILVLALINKRDYDLWSALSFAALIILIINPEDLYSIGFQLSFAAVIGLFAISPRLEPAFAFLPKWARVTATLTIGAQLAVLPLLAHYFGRMNLVGFLSNLMAIPLAGLLVTSGLLTCLAGIIHPSLATGLNHLNYHAVLLLLKGTQFFAHLPHATITVAKPGGAAIFLYYSLLVLLMTLADQDVRKRVRWEKIILGLLVWLSCLVGYRTIRSFNRELTVTFLDVGQGDAIVLRSPTGCTVLIDGGSETYRDYDVGKRVILPYLLSMGVTRLEAVIVSHPHDDHVNGLPTVLRELPTGMVLDSQQSSPIRSYEEVLQVCDEKHIPVHRARRGQTLDLGGGARLYILMPLRPLLSGTDSDLNNNSVVVELVHGKVSFLLTGDSEKEEETRLLNRKDRLRSAFLKVGHQGSSDSGAMRFLEAVRPEAAIISVGRTNPFGHPDPRTVARLKAVGAKVYRTDVSGAITVRTDGTECQVETFKELR